VIGPGGFAIGSPHIYICSNSFIGAVAKRKTAKLRHLILLSRVTYSAQMEILSLKNKFLRFLSFELRCLTFKVASFRSFWVASFKRFLDCFFYSLFVYIYI
jgi:hypothetical protein